jgi:hypothetical protein
MRVLFSRGEVVRVKMRRFPRRMRVVLVVVVIHGV